MKYSRTIAVVSVLGVVMLAVSIAPHRLDILVVYESLEPVAPAASLIDSIGLVNLPDGAFANLQLALDVKPLDSRPHSVCGLEALMAEVVLLGHELSQLQRLSDNRHRASWSGHRSRHAHVQPAAFQTTPNTTDTIINVAFVQLKMDGLLVNRVSPSAADCDQSRAWLQGVARSYQTAIRQLEKQVFASGRSDDVRTLVYQLPHTVSIGQDAIGL